MAIKECKCTGKAATYQDEKYGKWKRVCNPIGGKNKEGFKCTACGSQVGPAHTPKVAKEDDKKSKKGGK